MSAPVPQAAVDAVHEARAAHQQKPSGALVAVCICGRPYSRQHADEAVAAAVVAAVQGPLKAEALREAAEILGHRDCPQDPDRDPYIGCACRVSLLYARADRIEAP